MSNVTNKYPLSRQAAEQYGVSDIELALLLSNVPKDAPDADIATFLHMCHKLGFDPLSNQIHLVVRRSRQGGARATIQTGIDGYRLIAERTGRYAGSSDPLFNDSLTQFEFSRTGDKFPKTATITVRKLVGDLSNPVLAEFPATAMWDAYYPGSSQGYMWDKMPLLMLAKVAESLALRKAFPGELSGIYTDEEMHQASEPLPTQRVCKDTPKVENPNALKVAEKLAQSNIEPDNELLVKALGCKLSEIPNNKEGNRILTAVWELAVQVKDGASLEEACAGLAEKINNNNGGNE